MKEIFVFIYSKAGEVVVFEFEEAKDRHSFLLADGWEHIATIDACSWIKDRILKSNEINQIRKIAYQEGYKAGYKAGYSSGMVM